jgi:hypothetical protein
MPFGVKLFHHIPANVAPRLMELPSNPLPQRMSARDTNAWREPKPSSVENYLTFWNGNQLPGSYMHTVPHAAWIAVSSQDDLQPQYRGGGFGTVMSQLQTAQFIGNWHNFWNNLQARYGS